MSIWKVNVNGQEHSVTFESPFMGKKIISIDGQPVKKVGSGVSMWANYHFDDLGAPATIKFRAVKRTKGMSLFVDDEKIEPEPENREWSAEAVGYMMIGGVIMLIACGIFGLVNNS